MPKNAADEIIIKTSSEIHGITPASCMKINGIHIIKNIIETTVLTITITVALPTGIPACRKNNT